MTAARNASAQERTRLILEDLETVRENLLALSDDIWESIDRQDLASFDAGVQFMRDYLQKMTAFDQLATEMSAMIQQYTRVSLKAEEQAAHGQRDENDRIIRELNREQPHTVDEDFTYRRPHGFVLDGQAITGITTWRRLYELVCQQLARRDQVRFRGLPENDVFISNRGHREFNANAAELRSPMLVADGVYAEINHSANALRDLMRELLEQFGIPRDQLLIYLREDRDAERRRT